MASKHTPGPYGIIRAGTQIGITPADKRGRPRGGRHTEDIASLNRWYEESEEVADANAALFAKAPDLYEYVASSASNGCATAIALIASIDALAARR